MAKANNAKRTTIAVAMAAAIAMPAEGLYRKAYLDPVGIPTICFGATRGVQMGDTATTEQCYDMLNRDMMIAIQAVERCVPGLPVRILASFADAVYNLGETIVCSDSGSTARRLLKARAYDDACRQLPRWNKAKVAGVMVPLPGLTKRRKAEMDLCLTWRVEDVLAPAPAALSLPMPSPVPRAQRPQLLVQAPANDFRQKVAA